MRLRDIITVLIIAVLIVVPMLFGIYGDFLWFITLGYESVFLTILFTGIGLFVLFFLAFFLLSFLNLKIANRLSRRKGKKSTGKVREMNKVITILIIIFSFVIGFAFTNWEVVLKFLNSSPFQVVDPVFGLDVGFYAFELPFYSFILNFFFALIILNIFFTLISHLSLIKKTKMETEEEGEGPEPEVEWIWGGRRRKHRHAHSYFFNWSGFKERITPHLSILLALLFFVLSAWLHLVQFGLLFSESGTVYGAGYTDLNVTLPLLNILSVISVLIGILFLVNIRFRKWRVIRDGILAFVIVGFLGLIATGAVQALVVAPDEFNLENTYIERNIEGTLAAYGLDSIQETIFPVSYNLTAQDILNNNETISNIRLWDWRPLKHTYTQLQLFRTYYDFGGVDIDRYNINGQYKQVMVSAREMNTGNLPSTAKTWVNEHLVYTHGYGVVMNPVDRVSKEGLPVFYVKDIPPSSDFSSLSLERPEIYYGEESHAYVVTNTETEELDYPYGEQNVYTSYEGTGGVVLSDVLRRLVYAMKFGSIELMLSGSLTPQSRILMYRDVRGRIEKPVPFLAYDPDPYIVVSEGKLYWVIDAYTVTDGYPYSEPIMAGYLRRAPFNYIRNSVKVVMDAYNGNVDYYVIDPDDPVIKTYQKIFPDLFKDFSRMPADLKNHIRYPEGLFSIQATLYSYYHMKDPMVFYNKEDVWVVPDEIYIGTRQQMIPYYVIMKLPGEEKEEFILMLPFTPKGKDNMIGWMAASSDFPTYGNLTVFQFSKQELTYGPMQVEARIDQDADISQLMTLWSQAGSQVIRGNTLVIPIEDSILYIEPLYLEATERGTLPQLKRVIAVYGDKLTMKETLQEALDDIFGAAPITPTGLTVPISQTAAEKLAQIADLFNKAQDALAEGDLGLYQQYIDQIGELAGG